MNLQMLLKLNLIFCCFFYYDFKSYKILKNAVVNCTGVAVSTKLCFSNSIRKRSRQQMFFLPGQRTYIGCTKAVQKTFRTCSESLIYVQFTSCVPWASDNGFHWEAKCLMPFPMRHNDSNIDSSDSRRGYHDPRGIFRTLSKTQFFAKSSNIATCLTGSAIHYTKD